MDDKEVTETTNNEFIGDNEDFIFLEADNKLHSER